VVGEESLASSWRRFPTASNIECIASKNAWDRRNGGDGIQAQQQQRQRNEQTMDILVGSDHER
jgi:hypothetical protein